MRAGRTGVANLPLHGGRCPGWLFERMRPMAAAVVELIVLDHGADEVLRRLSDPVWFQALGCVLGFDWHSSGVTTVVCGALKEGLAGRAAELGLFVCGGKGRASRRTPDEIRDAGSRHGLPRGAESLVECSRMAAKVDNNALQDGYQIYHHTFAFTRSGAWAVVQQGLNEGSGYARRYHWLADGPAGAPDFVCEPHAALVGTRGRQVLNLVAAEGGAARSASLDLAREDPEAVLRTLPRLDLPRAHPVPDARRLEPILRRVYARRPKDYAELVGMEGVGAATLRALAMVAEVVHGAPPSRRDPVRYSFAHGGKDGHPFPVQREAYDRHVAILERAVARARIGRSEQVAALRRLARWREETPAVRHR